MCAKYPANSAGYVRHRDAKPERGGRKLTCLCYFNNDWVSDHGGKLRIWPCTPTNYGETDEVYKDTRNTATTAFIDIEPVGGRLVVFRSSLWHQVFPTKEVPRYAFTTWLTNRSALAEEIIGEERERLRQKLMAKAAFFMLKQRRLKKL